MFNTHDSYDRFVPIVYQNDIDRTLSTICYQRFNLSQVSYICSLFGANATSNDESADWSNNPSIDQIESVDVTISTSTGDWSVVTTQEEVCDEGDYVLAIDCHDSDFCLPSHAECAMDLDCCQTEETHMFCHPEGYCVNTV